MDQRRSHLKPDMTLWLVGGIAATAAPFLLRRKVRPRVEPTVPVVHMRFANGDGIELAGDLYNRGCDSLVVMVHGFTSSKNAPEMVRVAEGLGKDFDVLSIDLRGHGESGGFYDMGCEAPSHDIAAAARLARSLHYKKVALLGFSLGAAGAVLAAVNGVEADAVVSVACPPAPLPGRRGGEASLPFWRGWARLMGTRIGSGGRWDVFPMDVAPRMGVPLLVVHDGDDALIPLDMSRRFFEAASEPKEFLFLPGAPHAELGDEGIQKVAGWLKAQLA